MSINGIGFNPEIASIYQSQTISQPLGDVTTSQSDDKDSYIPSMAASAEAIPSGIYGANAMMVGDTQETDTEGDGAETGSSAGGASVGGAGGAGGGGSDSSEETTTTVVTVNGQTYLETTTTDENGNTTTTRTLIGSAVTDEDGNTLSSGPSPAAQALASL